MALISIRYSNSRLSGKIESQAGLLRAENNVPVIDKLDEHAVHSTVYRGE